MPETIYWLSEYNWNKGTLIKRNRKTNKIRFDVPCWDSQTRNVVMRSFESLISHDKCADPDEVVCVVWETWKGVNGRGAHRVERTLYPEYRIPAKMVGHQHGPGRLTEVSPGKLR